MSDITPLGPGKEFDAIRALVDGWGDRAQGIGDDAAVLRLPRGDSLIASVDSFVEGRHFRPAWLTPREIGYRAVAAALSDLAAMGARPVGILVALAVPVAWRHQLPDIGKGIGDAAAAVDTQILGGNTADASELSITTTVLGACFSPLRRAGAGVGDAVYVTGRLGGPGDTVRRLSAGLDAGEHRHRFAHPIPRIAEGRWLADAGASAAIDISDGLAADLRHLASACGHGMVIEAARIPCESGVSVDQAIASGEEYEIVVTTPTPFDANAFERRFGIPLSEIGRVVADTEGVKIHGAPVANASGYDHFSR